MIYRWEKQPGTQTTQTKHKHEYKYAPRDSFRVRTPPRTYHTTRCVHTYKSRRDMKNSRKIVGMVVARLLWSYSNNTPVFHQQHFYQQHTQKLHTETLTTAGCVLLGVLGDERRDLRFSNNAVVQSGEVGVGVDDRGWDAVQNAVLQYLHQVGEHDVSHAHLIAVNLERERSSGDEGGILLKDVPGAMVGRGQYTIATYKKPI